MNTKTKGDISVAKVMASLLKNGKVISLPFGDCQRYDLVMDERGKFYRIQVKTAIMRRGALKFNLSSITSKSNGKVKHQSYQGQVEFFGVYSPDLDRCYLIPSSEFDGMKYEARIRVKNSNNCQQQRVRFAEKYEI